MFKLFSAVLLCSLSALASAVPIASFDASSEVSFSVSDSSLTVSASSTLIDSMLSVSGTGTGNIDGSGDLGPLTPPDASFAWRAAADGSVEPFAGSVDGFYLTDGLLTISNATNAAIQFSVDFSITLATAILTTDPSDTALAFAAALIFDDAEDIFDDFFELDSALGDSGSLSDTFQASKTYSLDVGESIEIGLQLDASGLAEARRDPPTTSVPAPGTLWLVLLGAAAAIRYRKKTVA